MDMSIFLFAKIALCTPCPPLYMYTCIYTCMAHSRSKNIYMYMSLYIVGFFLVGSGPGPKGRRPYQSPGHVRAQAHVGARPYRAQALSTYVRQGPGTP